SLTMSRRATRSRPLTPKARAISRKPALPGCSAMKARISSRVGGCGRSASPALIPRAGLLVTSVRLSGAAGPGARPPAARASGALLRLCGKQREGRFESYAFGVDVLGQGGVDLAVIDIGPVASLAYRYRTAFAWMVAKRLDGFRRRPAPPTAAGQL